MTSPLPVNVGETLDDKYRIDAVLGQGGMGIVVRATHVVLESTVAIKFLTSASKGEAERRFTREARICAKLKSQHAARVLDFGAAASGAPYIVMEYLDGEDLGALLERTGPLPVDRAVSYVLQACEALAEAHAAGIVHRDVKPSNLMLAKGVGDKPIVKVLDFGVSKAGEPLGVGGTEEGRLTATAQTLGSPLYMAPEQINDAANVDGRADVWSIGVVLFQLLTGTTPWIGSTILALFSSMASRPPAPLAEYRPDVPPGLAAIIEQCLEKDRARRWPNVAAFAAALAPYGPEPAAEVVHRIASSHALPAVKAERPTEPMPAPGEASAFGLIGAERAPLSRPDAASVAVPARTSDASTGAVAGHGRFMRGIAIGISIAVAVVVTILIVRSTVREPQPIAGPIAVSGHTSEQPPPSPPEPSVEAAATVARVTTSTAPPAPVLSSVATPRPQTTTRTVPMQASPAPPLPATRQAELPGGSRR